MPKLERVKRNIYFYRLFTGTEESGEPKVFDPIPPLTVVNSLSWDDESRYCTEPDGSFLACWVERLDAPQRVRLGISRRSGLPLQEEAGNVSPLGIPQEAGLLEPIHMVFFGNNILGAEFNFYGPRAHRLRNYLLARGGKDCPEVVVQALLRKDVADQVDKMTEVRLIRLKVRPSYAEQVKEADEDLGTAFEVAARAGEVGEIEIVLKQEKYKQEWLGSKLLDGVKSLARRDDVRENASIFKVRGQFPDTGLTSVDVLKDQLIATKRIVKQDSRSRALDATSAFEAIEEAYEEMKDDLTAAAGVND